MAIISLKKYKRFHTYLDLHFIYKCNKCLIKVLMVSHISISVVQHLSKTLFQLSNLLIAYAVTILTYIKAIHNSRSIYALMCFILTYKS